MPVLQEKIVVWCTVRITWCDNNQILLRKIIRNIFISLSWSKAALAQQIMKKNLVKCCVCQTPRIYKHYDKKWYQVAALKQLNTTRLNRFLQQVNKSLVGSEEIVERASVREPPIDPIFSFKKSRQLCGFIQRELWSCQVVELWNPSKWDTNNLNLAKSFKTILFYFHAN